MEIINKNHIQLIEVLESSINGSYRYKGNGEWFNESEAWMIHVVSSLPEYIFKGNIVIDNVLYHKPRVIIYTNVKNLTYYFNSINEANLFVDNIISSENNLFKIIQ